MKALQNLHINRKNSILMIVDMQNEFCKPGGKLFSETGARIMPGVISAVKGLAERARAVGIPIIYIQGVRTLKEPEFTAFGESPHIKLGTPAAEIIDEMSPHKGEIVIQKYCHDPFYKTDIDQKLEKIVADPTSCYAIVTGGSVNVCFYHAIMGLHLRNYRTVVVTDGVYYFSDSDNQVAMQQFSHSAYPNVYLSRSDLIEISPA
jgi:nicotinamidase-related amidase